MSDFWAYLKNLPLTVSALVFGIFLVYLGLRDEPLLIQGIDIHLTQAAARIVIGIVGGVIIVSAFIIAVMLKKAEATTAEQASNKKSIQTVNAEDFFSTVGETSEPFPKLVEGSRELSILSITAVNLLNHHFEVFEKLGKHGCKLKFLFLSPTSETSQFIYGGNPKVFRNNVNSTVDSLNRLKSICGKNLEIRTISFAPPIGIILILKETSMFSKSYFAHVQLYFLRGAIGANRPVFKIRAEDKWFQTFKDEFDKLWKEAEVWETTTGE